MVLRPTREPGDDGKDPRLAAIPENITGRALVSCRAGATFGSGLVAVMRNRRRGQDRQLRYFCCFAAGEHNGLGA